MAALTIAISYEQGCCLRAGESLQTKSCNTEEAINELMSILLVDPQGTEEGK